jgi:hypothetical protein
MTKPDRERQRELAQQFADCVAPMFDQPSERFRLAEAAKPNNSPTPGLITNDDLLKEMFQ